LDQSGKQQPELLIYQWTDNSPVTQVMTVTGTFAKGDVVNKTITGLSPNRQYFFFVVAQVAGNNSTPSNAAGAFTWAEIPVWNDAGPALTSGQYSITGRC